MSNKIQTRNLYNKLTISHIKNLEKDIKRCISDSDLIDQKIIENEQPFFYIDGILTPNSFQKNNRIALNSAKSINAQSIKYWCKDLKRVKNKLVIC